MDTRNTWQTGRALAIVALVYCNFIAAPRWCAAQLAAAAQNGSGVTANQQQQQQQQQVYEAGDVFLSGSRVYVLVGKTGFGHEHGVIGQLKQGRINLDNPRDAGGLEFDMSSFDGRHTRST